MRIAQCAMPATKQPGKQVRNPNEIKPSVCVYVRSTVQTLVARTGRRDTTKIITFARSCTYLHWCFEIRELAVLLLQVVCPLLRTASPCPVPVLYTVQGQNCRNVTLCFVHTWWRDSHSSWQCVVVQSLVSFVIVGDIKSVHGFNTIISLRACTVCTENGGRKNFRTPYMLIKRARFRREHSRTLVSLLRNREGFLQSVSYIVH